jgi:LmbE family N-acetylglucosaminyl deacetylase
MAEPLAVPARALAVSAHPDDAELQAGATLARWAGLGCEVSILVCTDGSKGSWDPAQDRDQLASVRRDEQRAALRALGGTGECVFLDRVDGELESGLAERALVAAAIRRLRPVVVLGHDPWRRYRLHPDHRHAGYLACEAIVAARDPLFFPEQHLDPWRPQALLLWEADEPDHLEPVDPRSLNSKVAALQAHRSQYLSTFGIERPDDADARRAHHDRVVRETGSAERFHLVSEL